MSKKKDRSKKSRRAKKRAEKAKAETARQASAEEERFRETVRVTSPFIGGAFWGPPWF